MQASREDLEKAMSINSWPNICKCAAPQDICTYANESASDAYHATIPYLLEKKTPTSWTVCVGADGDFGTRAGPSMTQGFMYSFANAATRELHKTNVRFNEVYLCMRVLFDEIAEQYDGVYKVSDFSKNYEFLLERPDVKGARIMVSNDAELKELKFETKKLPWLE